MNNRNKERWASVRTQLWDCVPLLVFLVVVYTCAMVAQSSGINLCN